MVESHAPLSMARTRAKSRHTNKVLETSSDCAYFDACGGLSPKMEQAADDTLIKNALLLVEGTHKDNKGVVHQFPVQRIQTIVDNTNAAISQGYEVPLMADHSKELISGGHLKRLGELTSNVECRVITSKDLPNPKMQHLIGKLGAFAKVTVKNRVDDVKKGLIKLLSPGVDLLHERIAEVSAVAFPAIHGPALFQQVGSRKSEVGSTEQDADLLPSSAIDASSLATWASFSLDYDEAKEQAEAIRKQKNQAQDCFNILFGVLQSIDAVPKEQMIGTDPKALKRNALEKFMQDLLKVLDVEDEPVEKTRSRLLSGERASYSASEPEEYEAEEEEELEDEEEDEEILSTVPMKRRKSSELSGGSFTPIRRASSRFTMASNQKALLVSNRN